MKSYIIFLKRRDDNKLVSKSSDKYTFEIQGKIKEIFFEHNCDYGSENLGRWFMEWKDESHGAA